MPRLSGPETARIIRERRSKDIPTLPVSTPGRGWKLL